jgi:hypothetical protein
MNAAAAAVVVLNGRQAFDPRATLFAHNEPGAWYDASDLGTMFTDSAGTTPVTAVEQAVGRILDKSGRGNHAIQATAASRPVLRNRYNRVTYSEQFDNAAWTKNAATITTNAAVAPDGTTTADKLIATVAASAHGASTSVTFGNNDRVTAYVRAKADGYNFLRILIGGSGWNAYCAFNLSTGAKGSVLTNSGISVSADISAAGEGYYLCSVTATPLSGASCSSFQVDINNSIDANDNSFTGDGTSGILVWGADIRLIPDTIYPYQRIEAATVYDSDASKFPLYLACDGSDDSLYTAANLDLSSTDKVSVFAGVTKLSDAAAAIFVELSADAGVNSGSFFVTAPPTAGQSSISFYGNGNGVSGTSLFNNAQVAAPVTAVIAAQADIPADSTTLRVDAVQVASSATNLGTGNFGAYPLYIGRRNNTNLPFNGRIQQLIVRGAASSAAEISSTERWIAGKQGRSL